MYYCGSEELIDYRLFIGADVKGSVIHNRDREYTKQHRFNMYNNMYKYNMRGISRFKPNTLHAVIRNETITSDKWKRYCLNCIEYLILIPIAGTTHRRHSFPTFSFRLPLSTAFQTWFPITTFPPPTTRTQKHTHI